MPYNVNITVRRADDDGNAEHCVFRWDTNYHIFPNCVLFHHTRTADGCETSEVVAPLVGPDAKLATEEAEYEMDENWKLSDLHHAAPGGNVSTSTWLPERYQRALQPGESYTLLFTGAEFAIWEWGKTQDFLGTTLVARPPNDVQAEGQERPRIAIPGGARVKFTAHQEEEQWPGRKAYEAEHGFAKANYRESNWRRNANRRAERFRDMPRRGFREDERV